MCGTTGCSTGCCRPASARRGAPCRGQDGTGETFTVPHAICLYGRLFDEATILRIGAAFETRLDVAGRRPPFDGHITSSVYFDTLQTPENQQFVRAYRARFPDGPAVSADAEATYLAIRFLALAVVAALCVEGDSYVLGVRDVKFNFDRVLDANHPFHNTGPFPFVFTLGPIEKVEVIDPSKVVIVYKEPYAPALTMLAGAIGGLAGISPAAVKKYGKDFARNGGGAGPFKFIEWVSGQRFVLEANADYFRGAPKLKGLVFRPIVDENARVSEMQSGGTDITIEVPPDNIATFTASPDYIYYQQAGPHLWYLVLNTKTKPFGDKRVRQAINYAINKGAIATDILKDTATVASSVTPPAFTWAYDTGLKPYPYDPAKAKQLLADAGYPNGVDVTFYVTESGSGMLSPQLMGTAIQADIEAVGIRAKIETYEWNTFLGKIIPAMPADVGVAELSFMTQDPDMHPALALRTGAAVNSGGYSNPKVDALIDQGRTETDRAKRAVIYKQLQDVVYDDAPWVFVANWKQNAVSSAHVKGFELHPSFTTRFYGTSKA